MATPFYIRGYSIFPAIKRNGDTMPVTIKDEDLIRVHLKARELSEAAMICGYTSPSASSYEDRMARAREAAADLLKMFDLGDKTNG